MTEDEVMEFRAAMERSDAAWRENAAARTTGMTDDEVNEVCADLLKRAEACHEKHGALAPLSHDAGIYGGMEAAYRHAEDMLRLAWQRGRGE